MPAARFAFFALALMVVPLALATPPAPTYEMAATGALLATSCSGEYRLVIAGVQEEGK